MLATFNKVRSEPIGLKKRMKTGHFVIADQYLEELSLLLLALQSLDVTLVKAECLTRRCIGAFQVLCYISPQYKVILYCL